MFVDCNPYGPTAARVHRPAGTKKPATLTVDMHSHLFTPEAAKLAATGINQAEEIQVRYANDLGRQLGKRQGEIRRAELTTPEKRIEDMDRMMIDMQVVSVAPPQFYYRAEAGLGRDISRTINDNIASVVASHPDRFAGIGTLPMQNTELALAEMDRCIDDLGFRGIEICSEVNDEELSAARLEPFWAKCEERGIVVFIHPMAYPQGERLKEHFLSNLIGNPLATTVAVHYLIFDGVMDRHPGLKIVLAHGGGYAASYFGRMDHAHGAREDCCVHIKEPPTSYLKRFYFDTLVFTPEQLDFLARHYGADRLLMGSDYPFDMADYDPVELIDQIEMWSDDDKAKVWGQNAAALFGLDR